LQVMEFVPVLRDPILGANTHVNHFSDTIWHLNEEGSALRTDGLAGQLFDLQTWGVEELQRLFKELSSMPDGTINTIDVQE
jgi:hypothetical protein